MATNFKVFDENNKNIYTDESYISNLTRQNGNTAGQIISSQLINTVLRGATLVTTSLMNVLTGDTISQLGNKSGETEITQAITTGLNKIIKSTVVDEAEHSTVSDMADTCTTADEAKKLTALNIGTENKPVFFKDGIPQECTEISLPVTSTVDAANVSTVATNIQNGNQGAIPYQENPNKTGFISKPTTSEDYILYMTSQQTSPNWKKFTDLVPPINVNNVTYGQDIEGVQSTIIKTNFSFNTSGIKTTDFCQLRMVSPAGQGDSRMFLPNYVSGIGVKQTIPITFLVYSSKTEYFKYEIIATITFDESSNTMTASIPCIFETSATGTKVYDAEDNIYKQFSFYLHKVYQ